MNAAKKIKVIVMYGGRSAEHEVSCRSAAFILKNLDPKRFDVNAIGIEHDGSWYLQPATGTKILPTPEGDSVAILRSTKADLPLLESTTHAGGSQQVVVFPIIHGTNGEDGTLQGMLELAGIPFVGADTLGSAIGMDKIVSKKLVQSAGIPIVPYVEIRKQFWEKDRKGLKDGALKSLSLPIFVKPARAGSSVGVSKVKSAAELEAACDQAFAFDDKILLEKGLNVREIECAVLGDYDPIVSIPGEVIPNAEFYTYEAKYLDPNGASLSVPAKLTQAQIATAQELSKKSFQALELYGMARVDLFLEKESGNFYFNEVNTIPGFTQISQYPMLWQASGIKSSELLEKLIDTAIARHKIKSNLKRDMR